MLFIFSFMGFPIQLWNPNLAPLINLIIIYLIIFTDFNQKSKKVYIKTFLIGVITALALNFNISFGLGLTMGLMIFFLAELFIGITKAKNQLIPLLTQKSIIISSYILGIIFIFIPLVIFELRHGFQQIQTAIKTIMFPWSVVGQQGLNNIQIIQHFFGRLSDAFKVPQSIMAFLE